jgi:hypothetical protein
LGRHAAAQENLVAMKVKGGVKKGALF